MAGAHNYLRLGGAAYLALFVYGLLVSQSSDANFIPVNPADDIGAPAPRQRHGSAGPHSEPPDSCQAESR